MRQTLTRSREWLGGPKQRLWFRYYKERCLAESAARLRRLGAIHLEAFGILTYRQVAQQSRTDLALLTVPPLQFERQIAGLLDLGYQPWSLQRALAYLDADEPIPREAFVVVFDEGFDCIYHHAYPVLCRLSVPATVFLPADKIAKQERVLSHFPDVPRRNSWPLTTEQCREMHSSGLIDFGIHAPQDDEFPASAERIREKVEQSREFVQSKLETNTSLYATRLGGGETYMREIVRQAGFDCCLSGKQGLVLPQTSRFHWPRIRAAQLDSPLTLAAKLDGWYFRLGSSKVE